ncbi:MAG: metal-sensing transcriptional repressor [Treponemataceae bacterium]|nr:metal-sensing transcriptional repressor [Treponemataceae bacterium]
MNEELESELEPRPNKDLIRQGQRKTPRDAAELKKLVVRLNRIEGQIRGVRGQLERDAYCTDILIQVAAVKSALESFNKELLSNHLNAVVAPELKAGNNEVIDELVWALQKLR